MPRWPGRSIGWAGCARSCSIEDARHATGTQAGTLARWNPHATETARTIDAPFRWRVSAANPPRPACWRPLRRGEGRVPTSDPAGRRGPRRRKIPHVNY